MGSVFAIFAGLVLSLGVLSIWPARVVWFTAAFGGFFVWRTGEASNIANAAMCGCATGLGADNAQEG
jgi:predicted membrane metal-binding protein